ncbi:Di-copper centre-containing protein [Eremomyces bilateralis CBS 781.70]|uniref:Di-copper centre-containing protein n=1 Tax=Eremomyces bilateralis CBS 781.70 TaxID=1392243 RepID=A0A6G1FV90_9PEZI|nr:Di-copper centre-containing protein [Eremomyces bilateralis CBS 781.70]KAF1809815.1 Di-copper centre-containing protein [Eremomyces bilateralis CBS 781.70]
MIITSALVYFLAFSQGLATPLANPQEADLAGRPSKPKCSKPAKRLPWQALSRKEKKAYIDAELCLMRKPSKLNLPGAITRFDDLIKPHQIMARETHQTGYFLPFHRYLMHTHETVLRTECGYKGHQPYWAEELDIDNIQNSDVLDSVTGFGGGVLDTLACVPNGPFKNYKLHTGPGQKNTENCIERRLSNIATLTARQEYIDYCYQFNTFEDAWPCLEDGGPHNAWHAGVGGVMLDPISSPGDPLFYLHHTWLDKVWWDWQKQKPERLRDITGRKVSINPFFDLLSNLPGNSTITDFFMGNIPGLPSIPGGGPFSENNRGPPTFQPRNETIADPVKLTDTLTVFGLIPNTTVSQVMNIKDGILCYEYVDYEDAI